MIRNRSWQLAVTHLENAQVFMQGLAKKDGCCEFARRNSEINVTNMRSAPQWLILIDQSIAVYRYLYLAWGCSMKFERIWSPWLNMQVTHNTTCLKWLIYLYNTMQLWDFHSSIDIWFTGLYTMCCWKSRTWILAPYGSNILSGLKFILLFTLLFVLVWYIYMLLSLWEKKKIYQKKNNAPYSRVFMHD